MRMRNVIVTGGSRGLGLKIAQRLTQTGDRAIVLARNETPELALARAAAEAAQPGANQLPFVRCDLLALDSIPHCIKSLRQEVGPIYGLVNNAGVSLEGLHAQQDTGKMEELIRLNVTAPLVLAKCVLRWMMADAKGGSIVNISSIAAFTGYSGLATYSASKAALLGFTRSLAREVGRLDIRVNAVAPGFLETDMTRNLTAEQRAQVERRNALKRGVKIEEAADAVAFLLSDQAKSITGTVLTVDAGNSA